MNQSLDLLLERYQSLRHIGEYLLIAGLLAELLVILFFSEKKRAEKWGAIIATAVIIVGVGIETFAGGRADDVVVKSRIVEILDSTADVYRVRVEPLAFITESA